MSAAQLDPRRAAETDSLSDEVSRLVNDAVGPMLQEAVDGGTKTEVIVAAVTGTCTRMLASVIVAGSIPGHEKVLSDGLAQAVAVNLANTDWSVVRRLYDAQLDNPPPPAMAS